MAFSLLSCRSVTIVKVFLLLLVICGTTCDHYYYKKCDPRCGSFPWHIAGTCDTQSGRCFCYYGWTGPNSRFRPGTRNQIEADHCTEACHYTHDYKNTRCTFDGPKPTEPAKVCEPLCGHIIYYHAGKCLLDKYGRSTGRCLCWWGWTGPGAKYRADGRIVADYCVLPCYYTRGFHNPVCALKLN